MLTNTLNTDSTQSPNHDEMISLTSGIVSAYISNNALAASDLPSLIEIVYNTLNKTGAPGQPEAKQDPAVPIKRSVKNDAITCLECGKAQKMLKRHLGTAHEMSPEEYRAKWNLPHDYPMVAPDYAEKRRDLAKKIGLGRKPTTAQQAPVKKTPAKKAPAKRKSNGEKKAS